jgi:hypothetical protein
VDLQEDMLAIMMRGILGASRYPRLSSLLVHVTTYGGRGGRAMEIGIARVRRREVGEVLVVAGRAPAC